MLSYARMEHALVRESVAAAWLDLKQMEPAIPLEHKGRFREILLVLSAVDRRPKSDWRMGAVVLCRLPLALVLLWCAVHLCGLAFAAVFVAAVLFDRMVFERLGLARELLVLAPERSCRKDGPC